MLIDEIQPDKKDLLTEIRDNFRYASDAWREIREEAREDMRFVAGDSWDPKERARREDPKSPRPCLSLDELSQYCNQIINDVREADRAIQVIPRGNGAKDKEAELRGNIIRDIEYASNAQTAYVTAFENALQRSYGAIRISTAYISGNSGDQKVVIRRIPNPDAVYPDPDYREADGSDQDWLYYVDSMPVDKFKRRFPKAVVTDFTPDQKQALPMWLGGRNVQTAEYWRVVTDEAGKRKIEQYITNGLEILEGPNEWAGQWIPIVMVYGKEIWVDDGGGSKRIWESLIRKARDPQRLYNYYRSTEAEVVRMVPKSPFLGAIGQFHNPEVWQSVNDTPVAFMEYDPFPEAMRALPMGAPLPPPARPAYDPAIQPLEIGAEAARRAIQSAMGITPLPTPMQRENEKSGIALQRIQDETQKGSFHFVDNYDRALVFVGRQVNDLLPKIYANERELGIRKRDGSHSTIRLGAPIEAMQGSQSDAANYSLGDGEFDVTISTGPSYQSERDQADQFVQALLPSLPALPIDPAIKPKLLALALKLKNLGPIGEQIVDLISPPDPNNLPPQAQSALAGMQKELQLAQATIAQLMQEKVSKHADLQNRLDVADKDNATKIAIAEIETKAQSEAERRAMFREIWSEIHGTAHEVAMAAASPQIAIPPPGSAPANAGAAGISGAPGANGQGAPPGQV